MKKLRADQSDLHDVIQKQMKLVSCLCGVLQACNSQSLGSSEWCALWDKQTCQMRLEPAVTIAWPKHLLWARHKHNIRADVSDDRWCARVASSELASLTTAQDVAYEQAKLIAERISRIVKGGASQGGQYFVTQSKALFNLNREWPFEDENASFASALSM